jgi:hypothetical protein
LSHGREKFMTLDYMKNDRQSIPLAVGHIFGPVHLSKY